MRFFLPAPAANRSIALPNRSILSGIFNYNQAFSAFVKSTPQKQDTALVMGAFADKLRKTQVSLFKQQPAKIADLGCANSKTCLQYLKRMN